MNPNILGTLDRADELLKDLLAEYQGCLAKKEVSQRAIQLTHEVCERLRGVLDRTARLYWEQNIAPALSEEDRDRATIYFPISGDIQSFNSIMGRWRWKSVRKDHQELYDHLLALQPFKDTSNRWLNTLNDIAIAGKHIDLLPQRRTDKVGRIHVKGPSDGRVSWSPENVRFGSGVRIMGVPIDPTTQRIVPGSGLSETIEVWVSFVIAEHEVDASTFCRNAVNHTRELVVAFCDQFRLS